MSFLLDLTQFFELRPQSGPQRAATGVKESLYRLRWEDDSWGPAGQEGVAEAAD